MSRTVILFGAFDRHNVGDLLFPHVLAALLKQVDPGLQPVFAGLVDRDLTPCGGDRVAGIAGLAAHCGQPVSVLHVGGELLTCDAWEAAVMLQTADGARLAIDALDGDPAGRLRWAEAVLGVASRAPYLVPKRLFRHPGAFLHIALGGVALMERDRGFRREVRDRLAESDYVSVRDEVSGKLLRRLGVDARLVPDSVALVAQLFGDRIEARSRVGEVARAVDAFPRGFLAVQISADYGDDATLDVIADQLDRAAAAEGLGVVLLRAGAAPWHDDLEVCRRLARRLHADNALFGSLDVWDICALIAVSRGFCGSSLHGRIVAGAFARPAASLVPAPWRGREAPTKVGAYVATWETAATATVVPPARLAAAVSRSLAQPAQRLRHQADALAAAFRAEMPAWAALIGTQGSRTSPST